MTALFLALTASAIPSTPLMLGHFGTMIAIANAVLLLCVVALWFERERAAPTPQPFPFGHEDRLAA